VVGLLALPGRLVLDRVGGGSCVADLRSSLTRLDSWERKKKSAPDSKGKKIKTKPEECPVALVRFNNNSLKQLVLDCNGRMRETVQLNSCSSGHALVKASNVQM